MVEEEIIDGESVEEIDAELTARTSMIPYSEAEIVQIKAVSTRGVNRATFREALIRQYVNRLNAIRVADYRSKKRKNTAILKEFHKTPEWEAFFVPAEKARQAIIDAVKNCDKFVDDALGHEAYGNSSMQYVIDNPKIDANDRYGTPNARTTLGKQLAKMGYAFGIERRSEWDYQIRIYDYGRSGEQIKELTLLLGALTTSRRQYWDELDLYTDEFLKGINNAKTEDELNAVRDRFIAGLTTKP